MAAGKTEAEKAFDTFLAKYAAKYDKAARCLEKDRDVLQNLLRTSNPIESTFATVRHRTKRSKGCLSRKTAKIMIFKLIMAAQQSWRRLDGNNLLPKIIEGVTFKDGIKQNANDQAAS